MASDIPVVLRLIAEKSSSVNSVLSETEKGFERLGGSIARVGVQSGLFFSATSVALSGLVSNTVKVAGEFEQLQAKLESILGSTALASERLQSSIALAANTPFDVKSIVQGTTIIEAFGQSSERILPLATNLAAAMGEKFDQVSLILGKAFSGSLEGFESLRNRLGITSIELAKYGAVLTKTGGISVLTSLDLAKARTALEKIIQVRFGDAVERQTKTLFGALSNLGDSVTLLASSFGQALLPAVTAVAKGLTSAINAFNSLDPILKSGIAVSTAFAAGLTGIGAAAVVMATGVSTAVLSLTALSVRLKEIGLIGAASALVPSSVVAAPTAIKSALTAATSITTAANLSGAAGFAALAANSNQAIQSFQGVGTAAQIAAPKITLFQAALTSLSATAATVVSFFNPFRLAVLAVSATLGAAIAGTILYSRAQQEMQDKIADQSRLLVNISTGFRDTADLVSKAAGKTVEFSTGGKNLAQTLREVDAALAGVSKADIASALTAAGVSVEEFDKKIRSLGIASKNVKEQLTKLIEARAALSNANADEQAVISASKNATEIAGSSKPEDIEKAIELLLQQQRIIESTTKAQERFRDTLKDTQAAFAQVTEEVSRFESFLTAATKTDNIDQLNLALAETERKSREVSAILAKTGIDPTNKTRLIGRLKEANPQEAAAIKARLKLDDDEEELRKKISARERSRNDEKIAEVKLLIEKEKFEKGKAFEFEQQQLTALLSLEKLTTEQRLSLRKQIRESVTQQHTDAVRSAKAALEDIVLAGRESIEAIKEDATKGPTEISKAIKANIASLQAFRNTAQGKRPEVSDAVSAAILGQKKLLRASDKDIERENVDASLNLARQQFIRASTEFERLAATRAAVSVIEASLNSKEISSVEAKKKLNSELIALKSQEVDLSRTVTLELEKQKEATNDLVRSSRETKLEILKAEQERDGKDNKSRIRELEKTILADKIKDIEAAARLEIDQAGDNADKITEINAQKELKITEFKEREVLRRLQIEKDANNKQLSENQQLLQALEAQKKGLAFNRTGGVNSPLASFEELSTDQALSRFRGPGFRTASIFGNSTFPAVPSSIAGVRAKLDREIEEGRRTSKDANKIENTVINVNSIKLDDPETSRAAQVFQKVVKKRAQAILNGKAAPRTVNAVKPEDKL